MLSLTADLKFYLYNKPTDMRKGFNGLYAIIRSQLKADALSGEVYVFINRGRNRIKLLRWEPGGFVCYYKRLEQGTMKNIALEGELSTAIRWTDLVLLIEGITVEKYHQRKRFSTP